MSCRASTSDILVWESVKGYEPALTSVTEVSAKRDAAIFEEVWYRAVTQKHSFLTSFISFSRTSTRDQSLRERLWHFASESTAPDETRWTIARAMAQESQLLSLVSEPAPEIGPFPRPSVRSLLDKVRFEYAADGLDMDEIFTARARDLRWLPVPEAGVDLEDEEIYESILEDNEALGW